MCRSKKPLMSAFCGVIAFALTFIATGKFDLRRMFPPKQSFFGAFPVVPVGGKGNFAALKTGFLSQWMESQKLNH